MEDSLQPNGAPIAPTEAHPSFSPSEAITPPELNSPISSAEKIGNGFDTTSLNSSGEPIPAGRRRSSFIRTKSGNLIDGLHIGTFEEDVELQAGKPAPAFDMTLFMEKIRAEDEASGAVRDVTLTWENVTIMGTKAGTQEGIPVFWEPIKKIGGIPGKIYGGIKAKKAAAAAAAAGNAISPQDAPNAEKIILNDCSGFCKGGEVGESLGSFLICTSCLLFWVADGSRARQTRLGRLGTRPRHRPTGTLLPELHRRHRNERRRVGELDEEVRRRTLLWAFLVD
jgi:hypothetical protein